MGNPTARRLGSGDLSIERRGSARVKCEPTESDKGRRGEQTGKPPFGRAPGRGLAGEGSQPVKGVARLLRDQATGEGGGDECTDAHVL